MTRSNGRPVLLALVLGCLAWGIAPSAFAQDEFRRGDVDGDGNVNPVVDADYLLRSLFVPGAPAPACQDAADANDDSAVDISDAIRILAWGFVFGPPLPAPGSDDCGPDLTADGLTCSYSACGPYTPPPVDPGFVMSLGMVVTDPGDLANVQVTFDHPSADLSAWSFGVCHQSVAAELQSVERLADDLLPPGLDFHQVTIHPNGFSAGALVRFLSGDALPAAVDQLVYEATYDPLVLGTIPLEFCDTLGNPPVQIVMNRADGAGLVIPMTVNGAIQNGPMSGPFNDDCTNAGIASVGSTPFGLDQATTDGPDLTTFCDLGFAGDDIVHQDVWFTFVSACNGMVVISTAGSDLDTRLAVYGSTACPVDPASVLACDDDALGFPPGESEVAVPVLQGDVLLIQVGTFSETTPTGSGTLTIECLDTSPPPNDDCVDASPLSTESPFSLTNATTDGPDLAGFCDFQGGTDEVIHRDVWFCYEASCDGTASVSVSGLSVTARIAAYDGCGCPAAASSVLGCDDDFGGGSSLLQFPVTAGESYLIQVGTDSDDPGTATGMVTVSCTGVSPGGVFRRGDSNGDGMFNIADAIHELNFLFVGGTLPGCEDAADANDDGSVDVGDPIFILSALFTPGATPPSAPFPGCGTDPTADSLDCVSYGGCP